MINRSLNQAQPLLAPGESEKAALSKSDVFRLDQMPVYATPNGGRRWDILHGKLATGEVIALHASSQPARLASNPPHAIQHSEFIFVREGTLLFEHDDKSEEIGPGGIIFVARGTMHTARNVGNGTATYLVVAIGGDTK